jgi:hypothetical protein
LMFIWNWKVVGTDTLHEIFFLTLRIGLATTACGNSNSPSTWIRCL